MLSHKINSPWRCTFSILLFVILFNYFKSYDCKNDTTISLPSLTDYDLHTFNRFKNVSMVKHSTTTSIKPISNDKMLKLKALVAIFSISMISFMIVRCIRHLKNDGYYKSSRRLAEGGNGNRNRPANRRDVLPDLPNGGGRPPLPPPFHGRFPGPNGGRGPLAHNDECMVSLAGVDGRHHHGNSPHVYVNQQQDHDQRHGDRRREGRDDGRRDQHGDQRRERRDDRRDRDDGRRDDGRRGRYEGRRPYHLHPISSRDPRYMYSAFGATPSVVYPPPTYNGLYTPHYNPYNDPRSSRLPRPNDSPPSASDTYSSSRSLDSLSGGNDQHRHSHPHQHSSGHHHSPHHPSDPQPTQESNRFPTPPPPHNEYEVNLADLEEAESKLQQLVASLSPTPPPNQLLGENDPLDSTEQSGDEHPDSTATSPDHLNASSVFLGGFEEDDEQFEDSFVTLNPNASDSDEEDCEGGCCGCIQLVDRRESRQEGIPLKEVKQIFKNVNVEDETEHPTDGQDSTQLLENEDETNIDDTDPLPKTKVKSYNSIKSLGLSESSDFYGSEELLKKRSRKRRFLTKTLIAVAVATTLFFILILAVVLLELSKRSHTRPTIPAQNLFIKDFEVLNLKKEQLHRIIKDFDFERNNTNLTMDKIDLLIQRYGGEDWGWHEYNRFLEQQAKLQKEFEKSKAKKWSEIHKELDDKDAEYERMQRQLLNDLKERIQALEDKCNIEISQALTENKEWLKEQSNLHKLLEKNYNEAVEKIDRAYEDEIEKLNQLKELMDKQEALNKFQSFSSVEDINNTTSSSVEDIASIASTSSMDASTSSIARTVDARTSSVDARTSSVDASSASTKDSIPSITSLTSIGSPHPTLHPVIQDLKQEAEDLKTKELKKFQALMKEYEEQFKNNRRKVEKDLGEKIQLLQNKLHTDKIKQTNSMQTTMNWRLEMVEKFRQRKIKEYREFIQHEMDIRDEMEINAMQEIIKRQH